jgi:hypothetical protein
VVFVILAALWVVVLLPPLLRSRTVRSNDSIGDFNNRLDMLGRTNGALRPDAMRVPPAARLAKRRRDVARVLLLSAIGTGLLAVATNLPLMWALNLLADLALVGFFGLLVWIRSVQNERALKVRTMPVRRAADLPLRRAASS